MSTLLCFGNERDYADYVAKQDNPPSQIKAYFLEQGIKVAYSDYMPTPEFADELDQILDQIEKGAPLTEHATLRQRLGV